MLQYINYTTKIAQSCIDQKYMSLIRVNFCMRYNMTVAIMCMHAIIINSYKYYTGKICNFTSFTES